MGATFISKTLEGNLTQNQVRDKFKEIQAQCRFEHGHDAYNGTFSTVGSIEIVTRTFDTVESAEEWLNDNCEKWASAKAVRAKDVHVLTSTLTFPTKQVRGHYGSHDEILSSDLRIICVRNDKEYDVKDVISETFHYAKTFRYRQNEKKRWECVPATEMKEEDKKECVRLFDAYYDALSAYNNARRGMKELVNFLQDKLLLPFDDYEKLKAFRQQASDAVKAILPVQKALLEFDEEKHKSLTSKTTRNNGEVWVIGAIAAM
jgi:hypothetical protein